MTLLRLRGRWLNPLLVAILVICTPASADICSFVPPPTPPQQLWSDAEGWGKPEYSSTIRLADIDGDGRAELIGRGPEGIIVRQFGPGSRTWLPGRVSLALSDAAGWNRRERYSSIRLADLDGDKRPELLARADDGPRAWKYDARLDKWTAFDMGNARSVSFDITGYDDEQRHAHKRRTRRLRSDIDGNGHEDRVTRDSRGIRTSLYNPSTRRFNELPALVRSFPPFTGNQLTAYNYISTQLLQGAANADIRAQYTNQALAQNFASAYPTQLAALTPPTGVPDADWAAVVKELSTEFSYVADVDNWFALHAKFIGELNDSNILSVAIVSGTIQFPSDGSKDQSPAVFNVFSLIARVVQGIGAIFGQPEVSGIAGLFSTAFSAAASFSGENPNQPNIQVAVVGLEDKLNTHFQNAVLANDCLADYYLQDLTLLESLGLPIAQGKYDWDATLDGKLLAAARPGYELTLWQTLAPVVWEIDSLATPCFGQGECEIPGEMSTYPGGYYYLEQDDDQTGVFYVLKIQGTRIDQGEPFQPPLAALNAIFQPPPNGFGFGVYDVLSGGQYDPNGWNFPGDQPEIVFKRVGAVQVPDAASARASKH